MDGGRFGPWKTRVEWMKVDVAEWSRDVSSAGRVRLVVYDVPSPHCLPLYG